MDSCLVIYLDVKPKPVGTSFHAADLDLDLDLSPSSFQKRNNAHMRILWLRAVYWKFLDGALLKFFVLYYKRNIKHFLPIDIQLYKHSWKLE